MERLGILARRDLTRQLRHDMERFAESFVDRPLRDISARETITELLALLRRHNIRMPGPLAVLLKALVMMEGMGVQLDPELDVFGYARPYVQRAMAEQFAPQAIGAEVARSGRELAEATLELPQQLGDLLQRLNDGELRVQTQERELRRLGAAMVGAANRLAVALVLAALILGIAIVAVAVGVGGWSGVGPTLLLALGVAGALLAALALGVALLRGRE
jgi:ubiquinone biosynthesis protein